MPNYCSYTMRVKGTCEAIDEMEKRLTDYDHTPHFWRVFEAYRVDDVSPVAEGDDADMVTEFSGDCAWSVHSCMCEGEATYATDYADQGKSTSLEKTAEELGLDIEVYSEEPSIGFAEHYLYMRDGTKVEDETDLTEIWWDRDEYPTFEELNNEYDLTANGITEESFGDEEYVSIGGYDYNWVF